MELKKYAAIEKGILVNIIIANANSPHTYDEIVCLEDFDNGEYPVMIGSSYVNGKFIPSEENLIEIQRDKDLRIENLWNTLRNERNEKLKESDVIMFRHLENNEEVPQDLKDYRQELRDLPQNTLDIENVIWPSYS